MSVEQASNEMGSMTIDDTEYEVANGKYRESSDAGVSDNDVSSITIGGTEYELVDQKYRDSLIPTRDPADVKKFNILRNAYMKLDNLPLSFGLPSYDDEIPDEVVEKYFKIDLADTLRETRLNIEDIEDDSIDEMYVENRVVYHALKRFRLSASVFFKFSTAVDGKTVDKTQIPKILAAILKEYEDEYKQWRLGHIGKLWNRTVN